MDDDGEWVSRFHERFDRGAIDAAMSVFSDELETTDPWEGGTGVRD